MRDSLAWISELSPPRLWQRLRHYRMENPGLKLLALAIATLMFIISRQPMSDVRLIGVQLEFRGLQPGLEISGDTDQTVSVRLRGPRDVVRSILPNQIAVVADLSNKEPGDRVIQLKAEDVARPDSVQVLQIEPPTIRLRIEQTVRKRVRVEPELLGRVPDGFEIYSLGIEPSEVEIEGPQTQISQIATVTTESVQLTDRRESFRAAVDVDHGNHNVRVLTPGPIRLNIEIGEQRLTRVIRHVPVKWFNQPPRGRILTPEVDVELYGPRSLLESLRPEDLRVEIKTGNLPAEAHKVRPEVILPVEAKARLEVRSVTPPEVEFKRQ